MPIFAFLPLFSAAECAQISPFRQIFGSLGYNVISESGQNGHFGVGPETVPQINSMPTEGGRR
jgi:hypothetical protein